MNISEVIDAIASKLAKPLAFDIYGPDDIRQEIAVAVLTALPSYRAESGTLAAFLFASAKNHILDLRRKQGVSRHSKCGACGSCVACVRQKILKAGPISEDCAITQSDYSDLWELLDSKLHGPIRGDYLRLLAGEPVDYDRKVRLRQVVYDLLFDEGDDV